MDDASSIETDCDNSNDQKKLLFDIRITDSDKFINSTIFNDQDRWVSPSQCVTYDLWCQQSKVKCGFIPLTDPIMPVNHQLSSLQIADPIELHKEVKKYNLPNYLGGTNSHKVADEHSGMGVIIEMILGQAAIGMSEVWFSFRFQ